MKTVVPFLFIVITILCLTPLAESNRTWGGINLIANYAFISYLCWQKEIATPEKNEKERLFYQYAKWLTLFNCPYILACIIRGSYWSVWNTDRKGGVHEIMVLVYRKGVEETLYMNQIKHIESVQEYSIV